MSRNKKRTHDRSNSGDTGHPRTSRSNAPTQTTGKPDASPSPNFPASKWIWLILAAGLLVRLLFLGRASLWQDEIGFVKIANPALPFGMFMRSLWDVIVWAAQQPLSFIIWHLFFKGTEYFFDEVTRNPFLARLPAVCFGVTGIYFFYRFARALLDDTFALFCALLMAFLFFPVYYSREVYCYPLILFLAPFALLQVQRLFSGGEKQGRRFLWTIVSLSALAHTHLGCLPLLAALATLTLLGWIIALLRKQSSIAASFLRVGLALTCACLTALPFALRFAMTPNTAHKMGSPYAIPVILNDAVSKMLLGERPAFALLAWILFAAGIGWFTFSRSRRWEKRFWAGVTLLTLLLLAMATHRSKYLSVRYFTPAAPLVILMFCAGWRAITDLTARVLGFSRSRILFWFGGVLVMLYTLVAYLFPMYTIESKEPSDWRASAQWLNEHLEPGTPYMWSSGFVLRWVPGYFDTPSLIAVSPYIFGTAPEEIAELDKRQSNFARRFPVSAYIGAVNHLPGPIPKGTFHAPRRYYRQHDFVGTPAIQTLVDRGIFIWEPYQKLTRNDWAIDIFYNTKEDAIALAQERSDPVYFDFEGWQCRTIAAHPQGLWAEYAHAMQGATASFRLLNLKGTPLQGRLQLHLAVAGQQGVRYKTILTANNSPLGQAELPAGELRQVTFGPVRLEPQSEAIVTIRATGPSFAPAQAWLIYDFAFTTEP